LVVLAGNNSAFSVEKTGIVAGSNSATTLRSRGALWRIFSSADVCFTVSASVLTLLREVPELVQWGAKRHKQSTRSESFM
jgi:hypothetical protein